MPPPACSAVTFRGFPYAHFATRRQLRGVVWAVCCMVLYSCMLIQRCMALYGCMAPGGRRDDACLLYGAIQLYWFKGVVRSQRDLGR